MQQLATSNNKLAEQKILLWNQAQIVESSYARVPLDKYLADESVAKSVMKSLVMYGVAFIEDVEASVLGTETAVKRLFAVQKTFFGEMWSFSDDQIHSDTAYSKSYLGAHTDNTYFNDAAGLQVLHCIHHSGTGGENLLLDGFRAIADLKAKHADTYDRLCRTHVPAEYIEPKQHHTYSAPVIRLDAITGQPEQIRYIFFSYYVEREFLISLLTPGLTCTIVQLCELCHRQRCYSFTKICGSSHPRFRHRLMNGGSN